MIHDHQVVHGSRIRFGGILKKHGVTTPSQAMPTQTGPSRELVRLDMSWRLVSAIDLKHLQQRRRHFFLQGLGRSLRPAGSENWLVVMESVSYTVVYCPWYVMIVCDCHCFLFWGLPFRNHWTRPFSCCSFLLQPSVSSPSWWIGCPATHCSTGSPIWIWSRKIVASPKVPFGINEYIKERERERYIYMQYVYIYIYA